VEAKSSSNLANGLTLPAPQDVALPEDPYSLLGEYVDSCASLLEELEQAALAYERGQDRAEQAATIRRVLHKLKGEAGMVGFDDIGKVFHEAENAFEQTPEAQRAEMLLRLKDWVCAVLQQLTVR
jgi:HPt (histidine-containing phosphotransfer) domain-containing protein